MTTDLEISDAISNAIDDLVEAAYDTGYNSSIPGSAGQSWSTQDIRKRDACKKFLVQMIERQLDDMQTSHEQEIDDLTREQEVERLQMIREHDTDLAVLEKKIDDLSPL
jgi:hypothetical protein